MVVPDPRSQGLGVHRPEQTLEPRGREDFEFLDIMLLHLPGKPLHQVHRVSSEQLRASIARPLMGRHLRHVAVEFHPGVTDRLHLFEAQPHTAPTVTRLPAQEPSLTAIDDRKPDLLSIVHQFYSRP